MYEFLLVFGVILWLVVGSIYVRKPVASMYHPLTYYMLVHGLVFVIRPLFAYYYQFDGLYLLYDFMPTMQEKSIVLAGADLGFAAFALCSLWFGNVPLALRYSEHNENLSPQAIRSFLVVCAICLPIGIYSLSSTLRGTAGEMAMDAATGVRYNVSGNGYFSDAQLMVGPICAVFAWVFRFRIWAMLPFLGYLAAKASTGGRGPFIQAFITVCLLYFLKSRRKWPDVRIIVPVLGILALFSAIGSNREVIRNVFTGAELATRGSNFSQRPLESMDYGNMEFFEYLVTVVPKRTGTYGYFLDNLQIFTEPVPRVLWRDKPFGAPIRMYDLFDYGNPIGMTSSVPGEGWSQGGWLGIILWCGLFGAFYGKIYKLFATGRQSVHLIALYVVFLSATVVTFRDGVLLTILKASFFNLLPFILWGLAMRYGGSNQRQTGAPRIPSRGRPA